MFVEIGFPVVVTEGSAFILRIVGNWETRFHMQLVDEDRVVMVLYRYETSTLRIQRP